MIRMNMHIFSIVLVGMILSDSPIFAQAGLRDMAENGYVRAQVALGGAYLKGETVQKNSVEAVKWFRRAADQGNAEGQVLLALQIIKGDGVPRDDVEAYKWIVLATDQGYDGGAVRLRAITEGYLTPERIAEGLRRAREWINVRRR